MTQQQASAGRGRTTLWLVIGVAAVVLVGLLVWGLVGRGDPEPTTTPTDPVTTTQPTEPVEQTTQPTDETTGPTDGGTQPPDVDWGPVTPPNVDSLRDFFTSPNLPDAVGPFVQDTESIVEGAASISVNYEDDTVFRGVGVLISMGRDSYVHRTTSMADPQVMGNAVCGIASDDVADLLYCVVAGQPASLAVGTGDLDYITLEELAEFTNTLYDQL